MLFDDTVSSALNRALDGTAVRQRTTAENIANVMTPGYQAKRVQFESALAAAVQSGDPSSVQATTTTSGAPAREDGNNVVLEDETSTLLKSGLQYQALAQAVSFKHSVLRAAVKG